jgi:integrase/recombinase XerC
MIESFLRYIEFEKRFSKNTVLSYKTDLVQFQKYLSSAYELDKLEKADFPQIRSWIAALVEIKNDPKSVNRKIATLRSFFKYLLKHGLIQKDPLIKIKVLKTQKRLPEFVREEEINFVLDHTIFEDTFLGHRDKLVLELFYGSGIRLAEFLNLRDTSFNFSNNTLKVIGKRNKERVIPFSQSLVSIIKHYQASRNREVVKNQDGVLLLTENGSPAYPMMIQRIVKRYLRTTGVEKKSPHTLRHTYATHLLNKGAEINAVKDLLGHSSLAATQVYTHNTMEKLKATFEQAHPKA